MWRLIEPLKLLGRLLAAGARRARATVPIVWRWLGDWSIELIALVLLGSLVGYGVWGPARVRLLDVGSTTISAPAWVTSLLIALVLAVIFWLIVSQLED